MIKPNILKRGDKVAIVSLSSGLLGEKEMMHKYYLAKQRMENDYGLEVIAMPNALRGCDFAYEHPEKRAEDLMAAFKDKSIKAVFCAIGGDDSIRLLPYIDYRVIHDNPKIFTGYSDSTINHFMMNKAGLISYYGLSVMCEISEYGGINEYTKNSIENIFFKDSRNFEIKSSTFWSDKQVSWCEENINVTKEKMHETHGYEVLQGSGKVRGELLGGCIDVFTMMMGTEIWPAKEEWKDKILLIETSEEKMLPDYLLWYMRSLGAQGILGKVKGIIVGKPKDEAFYEEYKEVYKKVLREYKLEELPVLYNINVGHAYPVGILPLGTEVEVDFDNKKFTLLESAAEA